jgi:hypothetical protein
MVFMEEAHLLKLSGANVPWHVLPVPSKSESGRTFGLKFENARNHCLKAEACKTHSRIDSVQDF